MLTKQKLKLYNKKQYIMFLKYFFCDMRDFSGIFFWIYAKKKVCKNVYTIY